MLGELGGFAGLMLSAWLLNEGLRAEEAYRRPRRRPAAGDPAQALRRGADRRQHLAAPACSAAARARSRALVFGVVAGGAQLLAFGLDPMRKKGLDGVDDFSTERVARAIDQAEALVRQTIDASRRIGDRRSRAGSSGSATRRARSSASSSGTRATSNRARTFLSVYLLGLRDATVKFADLWSRGRDARGAQGLRGSARRSRDELRHPAHRTCSRTTAAISTSRSRCCASGCNRTG